jgi:imidazolonepropionase-like amidohydrolase
MKILSNFLCLFVLLAVSACEDSGESAVEQVISGDRGFILENVNVFDGRALQRDKMVVVLDGQIESLTDSVDDLNGLPRINGEGGTLLPGLMDAHTHTQSLEQLQDSLRFGVTTIFDMATAPDSAAILRQAAADRDDVADFHSAILLATVPDGHGTQYGREVPTLSSADEADAFVQARVDEGSEYLKIIVSGQRAKQGTPTLDAETVDALVDSAHSRKLMAVAHVETIEDTRKVVNAGVDGLMHVWRDSGANSEISVLLAEQDVFVVTTLVTQDGFVDTAGGSTLVADPRLRPFMSEHAVEELTTRNYGPVFENIDRFIDAVSGLVEANVTILVGTDVSSGTTYHGASVHRELELLVQAGLTPSEALAAATSNIAKAYKFDDRGVIAVGKRADLLLVRGDPTVDVTATRDILGVWRNGVKFDRALETNE